MKPRAIAALAAGMALAGVPALADGLADAFGPGQPAPVPVQWTDMLVRQTGEAPAIPAGRGGGPLAAVDAAIDALPYVEDSENYGVRDYWATPAEMAARGGDCEDYAIAKMYALRAMGYADADMRIAVVWDAQDREEHAVLLVREGGQVWTLDNKHAAPVPAGELDRYRLLYSVAMDGARFAPGVAVTDGGRTVRIQVR